MVKVCVDPGHGMSNASAGSFDPGAQHSENGVLFREADITLKYGLSLKDAFRARGIPVFMTRDDNTDPAPVGQRAVAARNAGCDMLISLHLNSVEDDDANGTETLYRDEADRAFAQRVQNAVVGALGLRDRGLVVRNNLAVLRFQGTAVLIELGFIGNDRDRNQLMRPQVRSTVCDAIVDAASAHLGLAAVRVGPALMAVAAGGAVESEEGTRALEGAGHDHEGNEPKEHDWGGFDRVVYDLNAPLFAADAPLTLEAFRGQFGNSGTRDNFNMGAFEALVRGWNLRHFSPAEFLFLGSAHYGQGMCAGLNSLPPQRLWQNLENTAKMIDEIRERFRHPIRIISAYRDEDYNNCVGGKGGSFHKRFNALDFTNVGGTLREMYSIAMHVREENARFTGGIGYYPGSMFVHIDTRGRKADW